MPEKPNIKIKDDKMVIEGEGNSFFEKLVKGCKGNISVVLPDGEHQIGKVVDAKDDVPEPKPEKKPVKKPAKKPVKKVSKK